MKENKEKLLLAILCIPFIGMLLIILFSKDDEIEIYDYEKQKFTTLKY